MQALSNLAKNTAINLSWKGSTERSVAEVVLNDKVDLQFNDARLNKIAMNTWNSGTCSEVFNVINKVLNPIEYNWKPLLNSLLTLRTIIYYGSEQAIDKAIELCPTVYKLQEYNSALQKNSRGVPRGGPDYGAPIREEARLLYGILLNDDEIRNARAKARAQNGDMLVPIGNTPKQPEMNQNLQFGMGTSQNVSGAKFSLSNVPNLYEGRPERYFDSENDPRRRPGGDAIPDFSTFNTADLVGSMGSSEEPKEEKKSTTNDLLDLVFNSSSESVNPNLPNADYLPALQKQRELEKQLAQQQEQLMILQQQHQQQQQQQLQQQQQQQMSNLNVNMGLGLNMGGDLGMGGLGSTGILPPQNNGLDFNTPMQNIMMAQQLPQQQLQQQQQPISSMMPSSMTGMPASFPLQQQHSTMPMGGGFDGLINMQAQTSVIDNNVNEIGMPPITQTPVSTDPFAAIRNLTNNGISGSATGTSNMGLSNDDEVPSHAPPPPPGAPAPSF